MIRRRRRRRDPVRPHSRIAIDRLGGQPGAGGRGCPRSRPTAWADAKVPLPKPRPIARNAVPKTTRQNCAGRTRAERRGADGAHRPLRPVAPALVPATRQHAALPPPAARKPVAPAAVAATSSTSQADKDALENVIELIRKRKPADATQAEAAICRSGRAQARRMADPAQRRQWRLGRALPRLPLRQSELAVADLPAPAPRSRAVGRPSRRFGGVGVVRKRIADLGQGQVCAREGDDRARRPRQCRAARARGLAQRSDVGGHRKHRARSVRRVADGRRSQGAHGHHALRHRAARRPALRAAKRLGSGHLALAKARIAANRKASNAGRCSRRCRANCTATPAISSPGSSCCAARRNSPKPPS